MKINEVGASLHERGWIHQESGRMGSMAISEGFELLGVYPCRTSDHKQGRSAPCLVLHQNELIPLQRSLVSKYLPGRVRQEKVEQPLLP
jgi:hypothetical protein